MHSSPRSYDEQLVFHALFLLHSCNACVCMFACVRACVCIRGRCENSDANPEHCGLDLHQIFDLKGSTVNREEPLTQEQVGWLVAFLYVLLVLAHYGNAVRQAATQSVGQRC